MRVDEGILPCLMRSSLTYYDNDSMKGIENP
jgi:hypothetical protein